MKTLRALVLAALLAVLNVRAVPVASALGARSVLSARTAFDLSGGRPAEARRAVLSATAVPVSGGLGRLASTSNLGRRAGLALLMSFPYVSRSELDRTSAKLPSPAKHQVSWRGYDPAPASTTLIAAVFVATETDAKPKHNGEPGASPAIPTNPWSREEVSRRQSELRRQLGLNADPDTPIPDQPAGENIKGSHGARDRVSHGGQRNIGAQEEHNRSGGVPGRGAPPGGGRR